MKCSECGGAQRQRQVRLRSAVVLGLYAGGFGAAYFLGGSLLHDLAEGMRRDQLALWKLWVTLTTLGLALIGTFARFRRPVCDDCGAAVPAWLLQPTSRLLEPATIPSSGRRLALRVLGAGGATAATVGAGFGAAILRKRDWLPVADTFFRMQVEHTAPTLHPDWKGARVRNYRRLGRTNEMVSDISLGSGQIKDADVARRALDAGVTYIDTAPDYSETGSERLLGEGIRGRRDQVFLATKFCVAHGHLPNETPVPEIIEAVEGSLKRLQTDHVDLIHIHSCDRLDRLMAPNIHEAFDRLKEQGKVRFLGVSTHTPNLEIVANAAIDSGRFDVMMLAYHFTMWPSFEHILEKAQANDVGIVAMKTLKGAKHRNLAEFRDESSSYAQAAFRWVLSNPNVSCLVISFSKPEHIEEYLYASGTMPRDTDIALLRRYDELTAGDYCQPHCGVCLPSCPYELPIHDILRYRMYFRDYGREKEAMQRYASLERNAAQCSGCSAPCTNSCPSGVPIREKMMDADRQLVWTV